MSIWQAVPCRPRLAEAGHAVSAVFLLRRLVKVKSLVCLNQCARKRPSYLCPVITETSFASQTLKPHPRHPSPTNRPLLMVSSPFQYAARYRKVVTSRLCDLQALPVPEYTNQVNKTANNTY